MVHPACLKIEFAQQFIATHAVMYRYALQDALQRTEFDQTVVRDDLVVLAILLSRHAQMRARLPGDRVSKHVQRISPDPVRSNRAVTSCGQNFVPDVMQANKPRRLGRIIEIAGDGFAHHGAQLFERFRLRMNSVAQRRGDKAAFWRFSDFKDDFVDMV